MGKAHLKDAKGVITEKKIHAFMHCIVFPEAWGLLFLTKQEPFTRCTQCSKSSFADWGCGKQIRVSTSKNKAFSHI